MKQVIRFLLLLVISLVGETTQAWAWGENTSYVLNFPGDAEVRPNTHTFDLSGPGAILTFDTKEQFWATGDVYIFGCNERGEAIQQVGKVYSDNWNNHTIDLTTFPGYVDFKKLKFEGRGTLHHWVGNVKVTRATTLTIAPTSLSWGEIRLNSSKEELITINYNNTQYNQELSAECDNSKFTVSNPSGNWTMGETGTTTLKVSFNANISGQHSGNIRLYRTNNNAGRTQVATIPIQVNVVGKLTPTFTFTLNEVARNHVYSLNDYFKTDCPNAFTITTSDPNTAKIIDGKLYVYDQAGPVSISVKQEGDDQTWDPHEQTFRIPITNVKDPCYSHNSGNYEFWDIMNIPFPYPTEKLTYDAELGKAAINYGTDVNVSMDNGSTWAKLDEVDRNFADARKSYTETVSPKTTHIQFYRWGGRTMNMYLYDFTFYMASYITPQLTDLTCAQTMEGTAGDAQSILVDWSNVENYQTNLKVFCDNPNFEVIMTNEPCTPANPTWGTGNQRWGQSTLGVKFTPKSTGHHTGTIYVTDGIKFAKITVKGDAYSSSLELNPKTDLAQMLPKPETYQTITLLRTLPATFSTLTIPFDTQLSELQSTPGAAVAQLALVTYNEADGYTLFFKEVADGTIKANQPYILKLTAECTNPVWTNKTVLQPTEEALPAQKGWVMKSNYTPSLNMAGYWGIAGGKLCKGGASSTLNAYTAYFVPPTGGQIKTRIALMDQEGNTTYIGEVQYTDDHTGVAVFGVDGLKRNEMKKGINIVRMADGTVRKISKR